MRLDLATQLKTRTGDFDRDAKVKNAYTEIRGEASSMVRKRPGVSDRGLLGTGEGQLLACTSLSPTFGGLVSMIGDTLIVGDGQWLLSSDAWDSGTSYTYGDWVFYDGGYWMYYGDLATSGTPPTGGEWRRYGYAGDTYSYNGIYDLEDEVIKDGITYYSRTDNNQGNVPPSDAHWSTSPIDTSLTIVGISVVLTSGAGNDSVYTSTYDIYKDGVFLRTQTGLWITSTTSPTTAGTSVSNWAGSPPIFGAQFNAYVSTYKPRPASPPNWVFNGGTAWGSVGMINDPWAPSQSSGTWSAI